MELPEKAKGLHLGIIPDGNRRFSKSGDIYTPGYLAIIRLVVWFVFFQKTFSTLTVYGFSTENWKRTPEEIEGFFSTFRSFWSEVCDFKLEKVVKPSEMLKRALSCSVLEKLEAIDCSCKWNVPSFKICSTEPELLPEWVKIASSQPEKYRSSVRHVNVCVSYSGKSDIKLAAKIGNISENLIVQPNAIDVVFRSSGEQRISDFCIWQTANSELIFLDKLWPETDENDFDSIVEKYSKRDRRFGK